MGFSHQLKKARTKRGLTQQQVADVLKIDKSTYSGYETGKREPDVYKIKSLAKLFCISGDELLETGFVYQKNAPISDNDEMLVKKYRRLNEVNRQAIDITIDAMLLTQDNSDKISDKSNCRN